MDILGNDVLPIPKALTIVPIQLHRKVTNEETLPSSSSFSFSSIPNSLSSTPNRIVSRRISSTSSTSTDITSSSSSHPSHTSVHSTTPLITSQSLPHFSVSTGFVTSHDVLLPSATYPRAYCYLTAEAQVNN